MMSAPVVLFVYNRLWHTQQTVEALQQNILADQSELFIFSDGPKNEEAIHKIQEVRKYIKTITGFKSITIIEREQNLGLAQSIISGVTAIVNKYGRIIVLEDDLVSSPYFLTYMNDGLRIYENEEKVISIHGYIYPLEKKLPETFFINGADCWGWATWKRGWDLFEPNGEKLLKEIEEKKLIKRFNYNNSYDFAQMLRNQIVGKNNSWAIRWHASAFIKNKLTLYSNKSLVKNIGFDNTGTHSGLTISFYNELGNARVNLKDIPIEECLMVTKEIELYFKNIRPTLSERVLKKFMKIFEGKSK